MQEPKPLELSMEQQFELRRVTDVVQKLTREEAQAQLVRLYEQYMLTSNLYNQMLRDKVGVEPLPRIGAYPGEGDRNG